MKLEYKDSMLNQIDETVKRNFKNNGQLGINAACYGILNSEYEVVNSLRNHGANIFMPMEVSYFLKRVILVLKNGNTALHFSAFHNKVDAIKYCIEAGANLNSQNKDVKLKSKY